MGRKNKEKIRKLDSIGYFLLLNLLLGTVGDFRLKS
jgi:hypothetical protein